MDAQSAATSQVARQVVGVNVEVRNALFTFACNVVKNNYLGKAAVTTAPSLLACSSLLEHLLVFPLLGAGAP